MNHMARFVRRAFALTLLMSGFAFGQSPATDRDASTSIKIAADAKAQGKPLVHFWSKVVGAGRANEGLRATWQENSRPQPNTQASNMSASTGSITTTCLSIVKAKTASRFITFNISMTSSTECLPKGVRPFVELSFVPVELATATNTTFWWKANGSPPSDYNKWAALVQHTLEHWVQRYGIEEVRRWYFEVWNEPNLTEPFFRGTQQQYFDLYKLTALTIKNVDPKLRVGGPATSNFDMDKKILEAAEKSGKPFDPATIPWLPIWIDDFTKYCKENNLPVDFISTHPYPQNFAIDSPGMPKGHGYRRSIDSTRDDLRMLRKIVDAGPYPKAEIQLTEWSSSPSPLDHSHDSLAAAAFVVKTNLESVGLVDSLSYWVFTDVFEENRNTDSIFHGGFGLINYQQIVKPAFHGYRMMNQLGDEVLQQNVGSVITRNSQTGSIVALAYNYPPEMKVALPLTTTLEAADAIDQSGSPRQFELNLTRLKPGATFQIETLDRTHGNAVAAWEAMGKPEPPTREQTEQLRKAAWATKKETIQAGADGQLKLTRTLDAWSLLLIKQVE